MNETALEFLKLATGSLVALLWFFGMLVCFFMIPDRPWVFVPSFLFLFSTLTASAAMVATGGFKK